MVINRTHNENIKTFDDHSRHLELEAECLEASKATKAAKSRNAYVANNDSHQEGLSARIMLQGKALAMDLGLRRQRIPSASKASAMARARMANASTVTRRETSLMTTLCQEKYSLTLILTNFLFPLMLRLLTHTHIGLLIQERPNMSRETESGL